MLDFIKYNRFELREHEGFCTPQGPNFKRASKYTYDLLGSKLSFRAPKQIHMFRSGSEQYTPRWFDDDLNVLRTGNAPTKTWGSSLLFSRKYAFYGPWFSGEKASASFAILAIAPESPPESLNLLYPKAFEAAISGYLTAEYGYDEWSKGTARYKGPIQWQPIADLPIPAVLLQVENSIDKHRFIYFALPVTSNRIVIFRFFYMQHVSGTFEERETLVSSKPLLDLMDNIVKSVEFIPSPEMAHELAEIRKSSPKFSVSETFPPLKWPATVDETGLNIIELNEEHRKALAG